MSFLLVFLFGIPEISVAQEQGSINENDSLGLIANKNLSFNVGVGFDTDDYFSALLNAAYDFNTPFRSRISITGRLGKRMGVGVDYTLFPAPSHAINVIYMYQYNDIDVFNNRAKQYNTKYHYNMGEISYANTSMPNSTLTAGLRYEHFRYTNFTFEDESNAFEVNPEGFFSYFANWRFDTLDKPNYPDKGTSIQVGGSLYTDNMIQYNDHEPFGAIHAWWKSVYSLTPRFVIIPAVYTRVLIGREFPFPLLNIVGVDSPNRYVPHQLPFHGTKYAEVFDNSMLSAGVQLRQRIEENHYVSLTGNYATDGHNVFKVFSGHHTFGTSLGYGYNSPIGPMEAGIHWSSFTKKLVFFIGMGYRF